jgi:hypothetical protein
MFSELDTQLNTQLDGAGAIVIASLWQRQRDRRFGFRREGLFGFE